MRLMHLHHFFSRGYRQGQREVRGSIAGCRCYNTRCYVSCTPSLPVNEPQEAVSPLPSLTFTFFFARLWRATHHSADRLFDGHDVTPRTPVSHGAPHPPRPVTSHVVPLAVGKRC